MKRLLLAAILFAAVLALPSPADFFQCPPSCIGTAGPDIIVGSSGDLLIGADGGNDVVFGGVDDDSILGDDGDDIIFGNTGVDQLFGNLGNDILLPGPDGMLGIQNSSGSPGNDTFIVLVGETANCQTFIGDLGFDVLHLIGFGPYIAEYPFGQPEPIAFPSWIVIQDPVAGGYIFAVIGDSDFDLERINGLPSPNVTVLDEDAHLLFEAQNCEFTD